VKRKKEKEKKPFRRKLIRSLPLASEKFLAPELRKEGYRNAPPCHAD